MDVVAASKLIKVRKKTKQFIHFFKSLLFMGSVADPFFFFFFPILRFYANYLAGWSHSARKRKVFTDIVT